MCMWGVGVCVCMCAESEESFVYEREFRCTHEESFETDATASVYIYIYESCRITYL